MTFTYDTSLATPLAQVRFEISDTAEAGALFSDEEIALKLDARGGSVLLAAADLCDVLAVRFAREFDFATDGQSFRKGQRSAAYRQMAIDLRARAVGVASAPVVRVDGFSQDLDSRSVDRVGASARRRFYGPRDRPPF